jgi:hypothetical protein
MNPTGGVDVCPMRVLCVVEVSATGRYSSRGVLLTVVRRCVRSRNLTNEEAMARVGPQGGGGICVCVCVCVCVCIYIYIYIYVT